MGQRIDIFRIEHDASLTRQDNYLGDSTKLDMTLYKRMINASSDGKTISIPDFIRYRNARPCDITIVIQNMHFLHDLPITF